jgi:hypothetical protein
VPLIKLGVEKKVQDEHSKVHSFKYNIKTKVESKRILNK